MPVTITVTISIVSFFTIALSFTVRQTMGRLIIVLANEDNTATSPAIEAVILPWLAMVAAETVVLALLTNPQKIPVASTP
jgi:hypothetical protein